MKNIYLVPFYFDFQLKLKYLFLILSFISKKFRIFLWGLLTLIFILATTLLSDLKTLKVPIFPSFKFMTPKFFCSGVKYEEKFWKKMQRIKRAYMIIVQQMKTNDYYNYKAHLRMRATVCLLNHR